MLDLEETLQVMKMLLSCNSPQEQIWISSFVGDSVLEGGDKHCCMSRLILFQVLSLNKEETERSRRLTLYGGAPLK